MNKMKPIPLGDIAEFRNGVNFDSSSFGKGIKVINVADFKNRMFPNYDELGELDSASKWPKAAFLKEGDIIFVRSNGNKNLIGRSVFIKNIPTDYKLTFSAFCIRLRFKETIEIDPIFYLYLFKSPLFRAQLSQHGNGTNINNLNQDILNKIKVPEPDLKTHRKISKILAAYDDLIENNNKRNKLLEETAEEIYKEWFVRFRFPGYENSKFIDKDGAEVPFGTKKSLPKKWVPIPLRSCLSHYIGGGWGEEKPNGKNEIPAYVIRGTDFPDFNVGKLNFEVLRFHTKSNLSSRTCLPEDIIFEVSGGTESQSLGRTCFLSEKALKRFNAPVICASFCKLLRIDKSKVSTYYISELLKRMYKTGELSVFQVQSTGISNYQFEDFIDSTRVLIPSKNIQERFEDLIRPLYDEIQILGEKNQILKETRDLLIPRLISGKLSVENITIEDHNLAAESTENYTN